ncbi:MAG: ABC transporter ATP-binding protein [[Eubacterium] sulci]|nr:ABC transporter ATP-binding protein [[Eubacterium] sulci]MBF1178996.1 ABC transporter ATP-binding protein [[Eubacterium] sulci]
MKKIRLMLPRNMKYTYYVCIVFFVLSQFVLSLANCISVYVLGKIFDSISAKNTLIYLMVILISMYVLEGLFVVLRDIFREIIKTDMQSSLRSRLILGYFSTETDSGMDKHGEIFEMIVTQSNEFCFDSWQIICKGIEIITSIGATTYIILHMNVSLSVVLLIIIPILSFITIKAMSVASKTHVIRQNADRTYMGIFSELTYLAKEIRIFNIYNVLGNKFHEAKEQKFKADLKHKKAILFCRSIEKISYIIAYVFVLCFGLFLRSKGMLSVGEIIAFMGYVSILLEQFSQINYIYDMKANNNYLYKAFEPFLRNNNEYKKSYTKIFKEINSIKADNISFSYYEGEPIISNLNFEINRGDFIFIHGLSGSGKTTLIKLLLKIMNVKNGRLMLNGIDYTEISGEEIRNCIAYLSQKPFIFDGTIFENIKWANEAISEEDAVNALNTVGLSELSLNELIGETGRQLSGGEKQRIALARCIVKESPILIFDEPFSQIDVASERIISEYILKQKNKIRIIVSHKLEMQNLADIIISFKDGEINVQNN